MKRCPFCKSTKVNLIDEIGRDVVYVGCNKCLSEGPAVHRSVINYREKAKELWNLAKR